MAQQVPQLRALLGSVIRHQSSLLQATSLPASQCATAFSGVAVRSIGSSAADQKDQFNSHGSSRWGPLGFALASAVGLTLFPQRASSKEQPAPRSDPYQRPQSLSGLPKEITLYQYEVCPFCCKVKAFLDYYKIPYRVVEVNPLTKSELKWSEYKKVPVVQLQPSGDVVNDSSAIMSRLAAELEAASSSSSASGRGSRDSASSSIRQVVRPRPGSAEEGEEAVWRKWVDERLVKVITANIYRSWDESFATFGYITQQTNWHWGTREAARLSGAIIMWQVGKGMPKKYGIEGDLREALYRECDVFIEAVGPKRPFLGGSTPNLADLAVYGVFTAVKHTPTFEDAMTHSRIKPWYDRMTAAIGPPSRIDAPEGVAAS